MPLDPEIKKTLEGRPKLEGDPIQVRARFKASVVAGNPIQLHKVEEMEIPGSETKVRVRLYYPSDQEEMGILLYFHGGGFVLGDLDTSDGLCRILSKKCNCVIASVDYRLAPEHKFPAAVVDALDALKWTYNHAQRLGGNGKVSVCGESAGGNLAAVSAIMARDDGISLSHQVLVYPVVASEWGSSFLEYGHGYGLTADEMRWYLKMYLNSPQDILDTRFSPLEAHDLSNLAPALVITAQYDPLRDQGEAYGAKLAEAGVPTTTIRFNGVPHGFLGNQSKPGRDALELIGATLRSSFYIE